MGKKERKRKKKQAEKKNNKMTNKGKIKRRIFVKFSSIVAVYYLPKRVSPGEAEREREKEKYIPASNSSLSEFTLVKTSLADRPSKSSSVYANLVGC
ncbi:hypothetical protein PUN28_001951 [Cardiocondyla obscurior]|uniref:Uncharacterized protein n=1 Tax=Cardiocondyla obscurior TaxID=286306 RepID=A0AAW2GRZ9_9HYME